MPSFPYAPPSRASISTPSLPHRRRIAFRLVSQRPSSWALANRAQQRANGVERERARTSISKHTKKKNHAFKTASLPHVLSPSLTFAALRSHPGFISDYFSLPFAPIKFRPLPLSLCEVVFPAKTPRAGSSPPPSQARSVKTCAVV